MRPKTIHASKLDIDHSQIDSDALYVIHKLKEAGYTAYLVGGAVRDLAIKQSPKDFDISTSAKPEEIKRLFRRNCLLIGRRFRLAHIRVGHKIIEVSTFRSGDNDSDLIIRDNTWGTEEEDVIRRDFTINGLFYDPTSHTVIDYVGGWEDVQRKVLRTIGDPEIRFEQDPVRMIRVLKFRARYGFEIEEKTKCALIKCKDKITKSSSARILEEILRMLESGSSAPFFHLMTKSGILARIIPMLATFLKSSQGEKIFSLLEVTDQINRQAKRKPLERPILSSCLLFPLLEREIERQFLVHHQTPNLGDIIMTSSTLSKSLLTSSFARFPKRISTVMNSIMVMQYRLTPFSGKRHYRNKLLKNKEFPLAMKFFKIRALADKNLMSAYTAWKNVYCQFQAQGTKKTHHHPPPLHKKKG